jgi:outer membrane protein assembly factor BamB
VAFHPPLVAGDDVYVADAGQLHVLDLRTGATRWSGSLGERQSAARGMAIAQNTLVIATGSGLVAMRSATAPVQPGLAETQPAPVDLGPPAPATTGTTNAQVNAAHTGAVNLASPAPPLQRRWRVNVEAQTPLVADGYVFAINPVAQRLDPRTGAVVWEHPAGAEKAAYDRGRLFIVNDDEGMVALDADTGAELWRRPGGAWPVAADGELYVGGGNGVAKLDPATGAQVWTYVGDNYSENRRTVSLDGPYVYPGGIAAVLSRATGQPVRSLECCPSSVHPFAPFHAGHLLESGWEVRDIDTASGRQVAQNGSGAPPVAIGNLLLLTGSGLRAFEFPSWRPRWRYVEPDEEPAALAPLVVGRHAYWVSTAGYVRAIDVDSGRPVWSDYVGGYLRPYTQNVGAQMAVGDGLLLVPTSGALTAYGSAAGNDSRAG